MRHMALWGARLQSAAAACCAPHPDGLTRNRVLQIHHSLIISLLPLSLFAFTVFRPPIEKKQGVWRFAITVAPRRTRKRKLYCAVV
jgi:hypothetical protein